VVDKRFVLKLRQWDRLHEEYLAAERGQKTWFKLLALDTIEGETDPKSVGDHLLATNNLKALGESWIEIDSYTAAFILHRIVGKSLVTDYWLAEPIEARAVADHIIETFEMPRTYLTNVITLDEIGLAQWKPISDQNFDACVVIQDERWAGMVAVAEHN
jgi:hypothetical protein